MDWAFSNKNGNVRPRVDGIVPKAIYRIAELIGIYAVWYGMDYVLKNKTLKK